MANTINKLPKTTTAETIMLLLLLGAVPTASTTIIAAVSKKGLRTPDFKQIISPKPRIEASE